MCGEDSQDAIKKYMTDIWDLAHEAVERAVFGDDDDDDVADDTDNFNITEVIDKSFHAAIHSGLSHPTELVRLLFKCSGSRSGSDSSGIRSQRTAPARGRRGSRVCRWCVRLRRAAVF